MNLPLDNQNLVFRCFPIHQRGSAPGPFFPELGFGFFWSFLRRWRMPGPLPYPSGGGFHTAAEHPSAFSASGEGCPRGRRSVGNFSAATAVLSVPRLSPVCPPSVPRLSPVCPRSVPPTASPSRALLRYDAFFHAQLGELSPRMPRLQLWTQPSAPMRRRLRRRLPKSKNNWVYKWGAWPSGQRRRP